MVEAQWDGNLLLLSSADTSGLSAVQLASRWASLLGQCRCCAPYRVCHSSSAYMNFTCSAPGVNHFVSTHVLPEHRLTQTLSHVYPPTLTLIPIRGLEKLPSIHTCLPLLT